MNKLAILNTHPIQYFAPLYRRLAQEPDLDITVYYCSRQGIDEYFDDGFGCHLKWDVPLIDGYRTKFLPNFWHTDRVAGFWSLLNPKIVTELRRHSYDGLLVGGHSHATYVLGMLAAKKLGIPVFMRCDTHLLLRRSLLKRTLRKPVMSFLYNRICSICLDIGRRNREFYRYHKVSEDRLSLVPFAVDNTFFVEAAETVDNIPAVRKEFGLPECKPLILFASKLSPRKRPMDLLMAFQRLSSEGVDAGLLFVGFGELEQQLKEYVATHNLKDVYFFGFRNQSELPRFYAVADVFVLPSEDEPWGLVINEVMCAGLPIVASKEIGAVPDLVVHGKNGLLFDAGNVTELTGHLSKLVESSLMREHMGRESRRIIEKWSYDECVDGIKRALRLRETREVQVVMHGIT